MPRSGPSVTFHPTADIMQPRWTDAMLCELMLHSSADIVCCLDEDRNCLHASRSATEVLGWSVAEMCAFFPGSLIHASDLASLHVEQLWKTRGRRRVAARIRKRDETYLWMDLTVQKLPASRPHGLTQFLVSLHDVDATRQRIEELELLSYTDSLTGLGNRRAFHQALEREWRLAVREGNELSLLMVDIDNFKAFNDARGHPAGDDCLRTVARALLAAAKRPGDLAVRLGGDEMGIILPRTGSHGAARIAEILLASVQDAALHSAWAVPWPTVSIGVATRAPRRRGRAASQATLIQAADQALYSAKRSGRNCLVRAHHMDTTERLPVSLPTLSAKEM